MLAARSLPPVDASSEPRAPLPVSADDLRDYMPLVRQIVARFLARLPPNVLRDDLMAAGTFGLIDSLRKNGLERGAAFEWYARVRIRGAILDELRSQDWLSRRARSRISMQPSAGVASLSAVVALEDLSEVSRSSLSDESLPSPLEAAEANDERQALASAMDVLLERERHIVQLHYFQGVQFKEIAAELGVSEPRVSQLHSRALGKLRARLAERAEKAA